MKSRKITRNTLREDEPVYKEISQEQAEAFAAEQAEFEAGEAEREIIRLRNKSRGSVTEQLEYIVENGMEAYLQREYDIREAYRKPGQEDEPPNVKFPEGVKAKTGNTFLDKLLGRTKKGGQA